MIVLFDLDGTLLDSRAAVIAAYKAAIFEIEGHLIDPDDEHRQELMRRRPLEYFEQHYSANAAKLHDAYRANYRSDDVVAYPGVATLLESICRDNFIGIVSNKGRSRIHSDLQNAEIGATRFDVIVGAEDTEERKPHPAPIHAALPKKWETLGPAYYVGDGPHDILASNAAKLKSIGVTWGYYPRSQITASDPWRVFDTVKELEVFFSNPR